MKQMLIIFSIILGVILSNGAYNYAQAKTYEPQTGDIIFHSSQSGQSTAIKIGTMSPYSHCGIIVKQNNKLYVLEAENGVELTPIKQFIQRGKLGQHYRIMRLKQEQPINVCYELGGKYDRAFRFNNGRYYCSELVWEIYKKQNGIVLCNPKQLQDYHFLFLPELQKHIVSRGFKLDQSVVAPSDLVSSKLLKTVTVGHGIPLWI